MAIVIIRFRKGALRLHVRAVLPSLLAIFDTPRLHHSSFDLGFRWAQHGCRVGLTLVSRGFWWVCRGRLGCVLCVCVRKYFFRALLGGCAVGAKLAVFRN